MQDRPEVLNEARRGDHQYDHGGGNERRLHILPRVGLEPREQKRQRERQTDQRRREILREGLASGRS